MMPKEDFLPGQTKELDPNAADTEALTNFYQSLLRQRPESEMAQRWLLQYGLLPGGEDEAKAMIKKLGKSAPSSKPTAAKKPSKPAANDDDFESKPKGKAPAKKPPPSKSKATIAKEDSSDEEFEEKKKPAATKKPAASSKPPAKRPGTACRSPSGDMRPAYWATLLDLPAPPLTDVRRAHVRVVSQSTRTRQMRMCRSRRRRRSDGRFVRFAL